MNQYNPVSVCGARNELAKINEDPSLLKSAQRRTQQKKKGSNEALIKGYRYNHFSKCVFVCKCVFVQGSDEKEVEARLAAAAAE